MRNFKPKTCELCGEEFTPSVATQRFCGSRTKKTGCSWKRREYRQNHRYLDPKFKEWHRKYSSEWKKKQRQENTEFAQRERARRREYHKSEQGKKARAAWIKKNIDKKLHWNEQRMLKKKGVKGKHSFQEWEHCKATHNFQCAICGIKEEELKHKYDLLCWHKLTKDHIIPIKEGGTDYIENIQPLCVSCNSRKWAY